MLDLPRYLLGILEIALLVGPAALGAAAVRTRLLPRLEGAPAYLAIAVIALALLIWTAELLGGFGLFESLPYVASVVVIGLGLRLLAGGDQAGRPMSPPPAIALVIAAVVVLHFAVDIKSKLATGMTGFDSTWYHGPFAAGFFQSGDTWDLHFIAPQFLAWFYPANAEIFHATGMLAFGRDLLSPLLNLGWFAGCLVACWCIGRPYKVAPWSLALGAVALSLPVLADQAGEARNDIVGIFFLLAAVAIVLNAGSSDAEPDDSPRVRPLSGMARQTANASVVAGLAAGLAAGTKLNFLLPAAVLVLGLPLLAPTGKRLCAFAATFLAALAAGGYWYLRNLIHTGNPLPWFDSLGPISLPAPDQALGGREGHSILGYLTDGRVWSDWFLPGLHGGLTILWPLVAGIALAGLLLCLFQPRGERDNVLLVVGLTGIAAAIAWLVAPTSASGPEGMPRGFESGLRYLAPALVLGLSVFPLALLRRVARGEGGFGRMRPPTPPPPTTGPGGRVPWVIATVTALLVATAIGYPVQRHYLRDRYANPSFAAPGLNAAFKWANGISDARIGTTSTRQYPLFGTDLSNRVQYIGEHKPHGGFVAPSTCQRWRRLLDKGDYDYVIATKDRMEPGKPPYPPMARWTEGPQATAVLREPPTAVFKLTAPLDPATCP